MQIIFCLFSDLTQAQAALEELQASPAALQPEDIGIVSKSADGEVDFLDTAEERELRLASTFGRVSGWLLGLAGAIVGAPLTIWQTTATGDLVAAEAALRHDAGFPDDALRELGEHLRAGSAAVLALVRNEEVAPVVAVLEQFGGTLHQGGLSPEVEHALISGSDTGGD
jgi:uncharacterized membrane protein